MAKKPEEGSSQKNPTENSDAKPPKRIPPDTIKLHFAGDLIMAPCPNKVYRGLFRRFEALLEMLANMEVSERILNYKILNALMLTSHAKKTSDIPERKHLFDLKNEIFLDIVNNRETRKKVGLRYLSSSHFRVTKFCDNCIAENEKNELPRHKWKFCEKCDVDRNFYNVLSLHHKYPSGGATLFLSNDLLEKVRNPNLSHKGRREDCVEEAVFQNYHYTVKNLDSFNKESVLKMHEKLMKRK